MALAAPLLPPSVAAAARQLLVLLTTMALLMPTIARAEFTVDFEQGLEEGKNVLLEWEPVDASFRPLVLFGQLFNQTERGGMISISQNITFGINASSYLWMNVPSPLPFYPTASYVVQLLPQNQVGNPTDGGQQLQAPVLAQSPMFPVLPRGSTNRTQLGSSNPNANPDADPTETDADRKRTLGLALGLSIGIPSFIAACVVGSIVQKRRKKSLEEARRRRRRIETVID